ncbi:hypothetical protein Q3O97_05915 [Ralstonia pseudosolanacearum]|uniref:hypothetical protein n=1 Tax=Ralstonia pseudosolanacearum TaxID=1310165 RepID=UPI0026F53DD3|nr:hypothetical protein [Ralstonia pseudosolanacearum]MDO3615375.1 hypothetical protein [Ralstonia pseudosolanacearum]
MHQAPDPRIAQGQIENMRELINKTVLVVCVFCCGGITGFHFAAWYLLKNLSPKDFTSEMDKAALAYGRSITEHWWAAAAALLVAVMVLASQYRVTRH